MSDLIQAFIYLDHILISQPVVRDAQFIQLRACGIRIIGLYHQVVTAFGEKFLVRKFGDKPPSVYDSVSRSSL